MRPLLAVVAVVVTAGVVGLIIGQQAAQTIGILLTLTLIAVLAIAPKNH